MRLLSRRVAPSPPHPFLRETKQPSSVLEQILGWKDFLDFDRPWWNVAVSIVHRNEAGMERGALPTTEFPLTCKRSESIRRIGLPCVVKGKEKEHTRVGVHAGGLSIVMACWRSLQKGSRCVSTDKGRERVRMPAARRIHAIRKRNARAHHR